MNTLRLPGCVEQGQHSHVGVRRVSGGEEKVEEKRGETEKMEKRRGGEGPLGETQRHQAHV